jgi:hypothetical protein
MPETLRMFRDAMAFLRHPITEARKALGISRHAFSTDAVKRAAAWNLAQDAWLQGRYGWRPFVYDVMSMAEAAGKDLNCRRSVRKRVPPDDGETTIMVATTPTATVRCDINCETKVSRYYRCGQTADYNGSLNLDALKWGLFSPLSAAWDLVPYSFCVDWFLNLGDMLKAVEAYAFIDERIGWSTLKREVTCTYKPVVVSSGGIYGVTQEYRFVQFTDPEWEWTEHMVCTDRVTVEDFLPSLSLGCRLNFAKCVDAAALLRAVTHR